MTTNPKSLKTLGEALPEEMAQARELIVMWRDPMLRGSCEIAARLMELDLQAADKAVMSGDLSVMIEAYEALKGWKE